jgi:hypothetical protein
VKKVVICEARSTSRGVGYGRDPEEAAIHAGWDEAPADAEFLESEVSDSPEHTSSASVADSLSRYYIEEDDEVPVKVKESLRALLEKGLYASAVVFVFEQIWDRGYEAELPESERKYT